MVKNLSIDRNSYIPFYIQVMDALLTHIEKNKILPGAKLPGEVELCSVFDVSRTVIRQALQVLENKGVIYREKGRGTFVAKPKIREGLFQELTGFYQDMMAKGHKPRSVVLKQEKVKVDPKVAAYLNLEPGDDVIQIDRVRYIDQEPVVLVTTFIPYRLCPELVDADLTEQSLYAYLENEYGLFIFRGKRFLEAVAAKQQEADLLDVEIGAPLILLNSVSYLEDDQPVEYFHAFHRGDRSRFETELIRVQEPGEFTRKILRESKAN